MRKRRVLTLKNLIADQKLLYKDIAAAMQISEPTLTKYINKPMTMDGFSRKKLSGILGITQREMDALLRGELIQTLSSQTA